MEKIQIFGGRSGTVWPEAVKAVAACREQGRRAVLYVPEQMTLQTERDLITRLQLKGLLDIEVISPKKLRLLVREQAGTGVRRTLDEFGQVMAVHRAMTETADELNFYRNMTELPGAVERIRTALAELRESEMTPEEAEACAEQADTGAAQAKLRDLIRIRAAYEQLEAERFDDDKTAWTDMVRRLGRTNILRGADLIVFGFDTIRPDLRELLCEARKLADHVMVFLTADRPEAPDGAIFQEQHRSMMRLREALEDAGPAMEIHWIMPAQGGGMLRWMDKNLFADDLAPYPGETGEEITLCAAADLEDEAEQAAGCLLKWHGEGIPWERMAVAMPKGSALEGALRSCLQLNSIPFTTAEKTPAVSHGVCRMLTAALTCISEGYTAEQVAEAAMSGFSPLTEEEALRLRNYAAAWGIEGSRWRRPFEKGEDAAAAEDARQRLLAPMEHLREAVKNARNAAESVEAVVSFLEEAGVWERLQEREEALLRDGLYREAVAERQVWNLLTDLLDQLWTLLGSRRATLKELKNMLECALNRATVSTLPETETGVALGEVGHMLTGDIDALVLPGCQEGILSAPEAGWLSDREREDLLRETGREVGVTRERRGWIRKFDYYRTLTLPQKRLRVSWSLRDSSGSPLQEDGLVGRIRLLFPEIPTAGSVRGGEAEFRPRTPLKALETLGSLFAALQEGKQEPEAEKAVVSLLHSGVYGRTVRQMMAEAEGLRAVPALERDTAVRLFHTDVTSISRLERYAACPYQHYIDYGLRPVKQETFDFDSAEAGTFFHAALDRFMKTAGREAEWPLLPDERVDGIMDGICAELTKEWEGGVLREDPLGIWQGEETLRRVHHAARVLTRFAANSDFRTIATEQSFGKQGELPPLELTLADGSRVALQGQIDRIDTYENGEGIWLRIVDNKSAAKKPEPAKMEDGEQLQLMIYLKTAAAAMPGTRPAGAMFFPVRDTEIAVEDETPETVEAERLKKVRMKGVVNAREDVVRAMDRDIQPYSVDEVFNKDGSVRKGAPWAVEEETLQGLMDAAERKAAEICGEIRAGRIPPEPRGSTDEDVPCRYCSYRTLCRVRREDRKPRKEETSFRDAAGKNTLREAEK